MPCRGVGLVGLRWESVLFTAHGRCSCSMSRSDVMDHACGKRPPKMHASAAADNFKLDLLHGPIILLHLLQATCSNHCMLSVLSATPLTSDKLL